MFMTHTQKASLAAKIANALADATGTGVSGRTLQKVSAVICAVLEGEFPEPVFEGKAAPVTPSLFTTHDVSRMLQVDASTVAKWIDKGILIAFRTPGGHRRVRHGDLLQFINKHGMPIPEELSEKGGK